MPATNDVPNSYKNPLILNGKHSITQLIVRHYHQECNHGNHNTVMNKICQKYYVTSIRYTAKVTTKEYQWRKTRGAVPATSPTGDLPDERWQMKYHSFTCTTVDYFGPITIGKKTDKWWIALYTCMPTRAVHLEIAKSLSADNMILTLTRMIARRGTPKAIDSDNGTHFIGVNKGLKTEFHKMADKTEVKGICWKFIFPRALHIGRAWKSLVRSIKTALTVFLNSRHPSEEIQHTSLLEAEHLTNSRPITDVSIDPDDKGSLTNGAYRMRSFSDNELTGTLTWKTAQQLADHFCKRWLSEYLPLLAP